jgi:Uma2 family endonuclease
MMAIITDINQLDANAHYTYADYLLWQFRERVELLRGHFQQMAAPNVRHQRISSEIARKLGNHLEGRNCDVFAAPFDVRLPLPPHRIKTDKIDTVVQPDICVICDPSKLDERGCIGAPELVVEILSPGNSKREMKDKLNLYESAGVLEYWVIDPEHEIVLTYTLDQNTGVFVSGRPLTDEDTLKSVVLEGFSMELNPIFKK